LAAYYTPSRTLNMKSIIVGTAGHIDHGKTALVRALTGIDADRLPEEKRRGITIDIGFADLDLGEVRVGFVDVPGHERFVKNMLAGAHGIDLVVLVIAADESIMPQTREHFEICRLLGVQRGLVVLTKKDLVEEELLALVRDEVNELVSGSFLENAPIVAVSSKTGEGLDQLRTVLREVALQVPSRSADFIARLPIDRAFAMTGFGAVVTGTLIAGEINEGAEMDLLPEQVRVRVRGLQVHGRKVEHAFAGQRTAVNLGGVETAALQRGMVLAPPRTFQPTQVVDAQVQMLDDAPRGLRSRQRVRVNIGAAEVLARLSVIEESGKIDPGQKGFVQVRLESPIVGVLGDRFIVRSYSPQRTIGGGTILDAFATKHRARELTATRKTLAVLLEGDRAKQVATFVAISERNGLNVANLIARTGLREEAIKVAIADALQASTIVDLQGQLFSPHIIDEFKKLILDDVAAHHQKEPLSRGLALEVLRGRHFLNLSPDLFRELLADLEKQSLLVVEKDVVRSPAHSRAASGADAALQDQLESIYREAKLAPPSLTDALTRAGATGAKQAHGRKVLQLLLDSGTLIRVDGEMLFHRAALDELIATLRTKVKAGQAIEVPAFKELAGISRKYAIPLLEYLDRQRVTRREGDRRVVL
jgi:selenocysteine-specific elongation factor